MKVVLFVWFVCGGSQSWSCGAHDTMARVATYACGNDSVDSPLFLTPLIESGQLDRARRQSLVGSLGPVKDVPSYSGFLTVDADLGSNLFFWFFPAQVGPQTAPVLLWLQGGPGYTSLFGVFVEHGPYLVGQDGSPKLRDVTWVEGFNVLYVDNPVGAGFSFTESDQGYARNLTDITGNLLEALQQFFTLFAEYAHNDFYVTGESYAGQYVPALAYAIDTAVNPRVKINLKGISIGNGAIDPGATMDRSDYLYQIGLLDRNAAAIFKQKAKLITQLINDGQYRDALLMANALILPFSPKPSYFTNVTGMNFIYNYLYSETPKDYTYFEAFIVTPTARQALHVGNRTFTYLSIVVQEYLLESLLASAESYFKAVIEKYKVLVYNGQLDISVAYPLTENFLSNLQWSGASAFAQAPRQIWRTPDGADVAGYVRQVGNFTEVMVRNAGHEASHGQPVNILDMITRFIHDRPFSN